MSKEFTSVLNEDIKNITISLESYWQEIEGATVLISGATGLIGSFLVRLLDNVNRDFGKNIRIIGLVRDLEKARSNSRLKGLSDLVTLSEYENVLKSTQLEKVDYFIHTASPTSSSYFVNYPVETIVSTIELTYSLLSNLLNKGLKSSVFLSTMEIYGQCSKSLIAERDYGYLDPLEIRSSYPEMKRIMENLCVAFVSEHNLPVKICRLTQCFGPGVDIKNDNRVFAQFLRSIINKQPLLLETEGKTERSYVYLADAIEAILFVLLRGKNGEAYNVANPDTYCSIREIAQLLCKRYSLDLEIKPRFNPAYCKDQKINLDISKLLKLGWRPKYDLLSCYERMLVDYRQNSCMF